jgi:hypothetical protein
MASPDLSALSHLGPFSHLAFAFVTGILPNFICVCCLAYVANCQTAWHLVLN